MMVIKCNTHMWICLLLIPVFFFIFFAIDVHIFVASGFFILTRFVLLYILHVGMSATPLPPPLVNWIV